MKCRALLLLAIPFMSVSCCEDPKPTQIPTPLQDATVPAAGEIDVVIHGLVAFVPLGATKADGLKSVFLSPMADEHVPFVSLASGDVYKGNTSVPDHLAGGESGGGLALWRFTELKLDGNIAENPIEYDSNKLASDEQNFDKLRWVPFLDDILGATEPHDPTELAKAAATADWKYGNLTPVFDTDSHRTELWTIGERKDRALADGVRIRLALKDPAQPAVLRINRTGSWEEIPVMGGTTLQFSGYPKVIPQPGADLAHFHHFYQLRKIDKTGPPPKKALTAPSPEPVRCAPFIVIE